MTPPSASPHPGSRAAAVLPASQSAQGVAIRRGRAGSPGHTAGTIPLTGTAPVDRRLPGFRLPIASLPWLTVIRSPKRAVIRTASFARTLYTICTRTLPYIDPQ